MNINNLIRKNIKKAKAYSSARDEFQTASNSYVFLDANENPFPTKVNRYPDPNQTALKKKIAEIKDVPTSQLLLGNGSDEVLDLLFRAFCEPGVDNVITLPPTYGMYGVLAALNNIENREIPLTSSFQFPLAEIVSASTKNSKLLFICSPNNPTGNVMDVAAIEKIIASFPGLIVIDEAYIDFVEGEKSWTEKINKYPNLVVIQTLSKAYGLAGIRLGILVSNEDIIGVLKKIKMPYNVNSLTQEYALQCLENTTKTKEQVREVISERKRVASALQSFSFVKKVYPSQANFILVKCSNASHLYNYLIEHGVVVRNRSTVIGCENTLRITIGTPSDNNKLLNILTNYSNE